MQLKKKFILGFALGALAVGAIYLGATRRQSVDKGILSQAIPTLELRTFLAAQALNIPEADLFHQIVQLLRDKYVEDVPYDNKLAIGAIRGMVANLADPSCIFMNPKQLEVFQNVQKGIFEGIGVETQFYYRPEQLKAFKDEHVTDGALFIPSLIVTDPVAGGPAEKAGICSGDRITYINDRWVLSFEELLKLRKLQEDASKDKNKTTSLESLRKKLTQQLKTSLTPALAKELLTQNKEGSVKLSWTRGDKAFSATLPLKQTLVPSVKWVNKQTLKLKFYKGADKKLRDSINGISELTIDLRGNLQGDFYTMKECLEQLVPKGSYGQLINKEHKSEKQLFVERGSTHSPTMKLLIDSYTQGPAKIFALALASRKKAELICPKNESFVKEQEVIEVFSLPDGSGYTLSTSLFKP